MKHRKGLVGKGGKGYSWRYKDRADKNALPGMEVPEADTDASDAVESKGSSGGAATTLLFGRKKKRRCLWCMERVELIDYKNISRLRRFISDRGKILPRRQTGACAKHQRQISTAIKRARFIGLLPYVAR